MKPSVPPSCRACGESRLEPVYRLAGVPVHSCVLLEDAGEARRFPRGDLVLEFCPGCGLLQNSAFDDAAMDYASGYEDSQAHSERWVAWASEIASGLVERYGLRGRHALEVGCGKGDFLALLGQVGGMTGTGYDPAYVPGPLVKPGQTGLRFVKARFTGLVVDDVLADLICCRHTLEHVADPRGLVDLVAEAARRREGAVVFFEVPDTIRILEELAFWDVYYEHCSYFTPGSLGRLFRQRGLEVLDVRSEYDGQYLLLEAAAGSPGPALPAEEDLEVLGRLVDRFRTRVPERLARLRADLDSLVELGRDVVLWGASSKAVSYLTSLGVDDEVSGVVDISPAKAGRFLAGTGHRVLAPAELRELQPDVVIVMNPVYEGEVARTLEVIGVRAELRTLDGVAGARTSDPITTA